MAPDAAQILAAAATEASANLRAYQIQLMAHRLELVTGFDDLLALDAIGFTPFDYQTRAARTALRRFRGRGLLSDEVGLGKTIEAGLVLKEYLLRQMVRRVLILTPPGLVEQWREELTTKFDITDFVTSNDEAFRTRGPDAWTHFPHVIASLATARRPEHRQVITAEMYDLVIVDEAHHLKNRTSVSWKLVNELQKRFILLLTATPVQNSLNELYNLVTVLKPGQLKSPKEFQREFVVRGDPRLPKNRGRLRDLLSDVMVRHSRSQISLQLPPRRAHTIQLHLFDDERQLYDAIAALSRRMLVDEEVTSAHRFGMRSLLREAGSSAAATRATLRSLAEVAGLAAYRAELLRLAELAHKTFSFPNARLDATPKVQEQGALHHYLHCNFKITLVGEEKQEELATVVMDVQAGHAVRDAAILRRLDVFAMESELADLPVAPPRWLGAGPTFSAETLQALLPRAEHALRQDMAGQVAALVARMERHLALDLARIGDYYDDLTTDLQRRRARLSEEDAVRGQNLDDKLAALEAERTAKLQDVHARYAVRVEMELINVLLLTQPKVILPVTISNRATTITRTVVWDPLVHRLEPLVCDVCGQPGEGLHLCTGGHLAHATCLAPQCIDCKRAFCQLCATQITACVVCHRPVCRPSLITCPTCGRGTCREHQQLCHAANGQPVALPE